MTRGKLGAMKALLLLALIVSGCGTGRHRQRPEKPYYVKARERFQACMAKNDEARRTRALCAGDPSCEVRTPDGRRRSAEQEARQCDNEAREAEMAQREELHDDEQRQAWGRAIYSKK